MLRTECHVIGDLGLSMLGIDAPTWQLCERQNLPSMVLYHYREQIPTGSVGASMSVREGKLSAAPYCVPRIVYFRLCGSHKGIPALIF